MHAQRNHWAHPNWQQKKPPLSAQRAAKACKNAGLDTINQARGVKKKQDEVIIFDNDKDDIKGRLGSRSVC